MVQRAKVHADNEKVPNPEVSRLGTTLATSHEIRPRLLFAYSCMMALTPAKRTMPSMQL